MKNTKNMQKKATRKIYKSDKKWNESPQHKAWYKTHKDSHMISNQRWNRNHKAKVRLYRVRSYFKRFNGIPNKFQMARHQVPKPIATVKDMRSEVTRITRRLEHLKKLEKSDK